MSYSYHLIAINTTVFETIKNMDKEELSSYLCNESNKSKCDAFWDIILSKQLYDLGGLSDEIYDYIMESTKDLFTKESSQNEFYDYTLKVANKDILCGIINIYQENTKKYYQQFFKPDVLGKKRYYQMTIDDIADDKKEELFSMLYHHCIGNSINMDENQPTILTNSWDYEFAIFNLLHILKSFDWKNETLLICGW